MTDNLRDWWTGRTQRERVLLLVLAALLGAMTAWLGVWRPVNSFLDSARMEQGEALDGLARTQAMVAEAKRIGTAQASGALDVGGVITQSAIEAGFTLARNEQRQAGAFAVAISAAKSRALFVWLGTLERQGIIAQSATVRANGDGTVSFDAVLKGRGA
ncbi:hypothetical protein D5I55_01315 [Chakrabartia godavariana]|nr:hypothetical protein D5I55_01315 [Chakrabartia godavariana]